MQYKMHEAFLWKALRVFYYHSQKMLWSQLRATMLPMYVPKITQNQNLSKAKYRFFIVSTTVYRINFFNDHLILYHNITHLMGDI